MRRRGQRAAVVISASVLAGMTLAGCGAGLLPSDDVLHGPGAVHTPTAPPPPKNTLPPERATEIASTLCPRTIDAAAIADLTQPAADAADFFAGTAQCGDLPAVLAAGDAAPPFLSPMQYVDAACPTTMLSFWAHFDDDLIFGSPAIPEAIRAGTCVRTFFFTGSDAGMGADYAAARETGIRAAYDVIRGAEGQWVDRSVVLRSGVTLTVTRPEDDPRLTLFLLRLPDGGLDAGGFPATGRQSMSQLLEGTIGQITTIDSGEAYALEQLASTVAELAAAYRPSQVISHLPGFAAGAAGDHPDHRAVGRIVAGEVDGGRIDPSTVVYATGYPTEARTANVAGAELDAKLRAFSAYAAHDAVLRCADPASCLRLPRFGAWLQRQYLVLHAELQR